MPTHYESPSRMDRRINAIVGWLADRGVNLAGAQTLTVAGRISGTPQRVPVNPLTVDGREYLVGIRGETQWVRNARAAGVVELRRGRRRRQMTLTEVPPADRAPILRAYLDQWGWEVKSLLPDAVPVDASEASLSAHAATFPTFALSS